MAICKDGHIVALWDFGDVGKEFIKYLSLGGGFGEGIVKLGLEYREGVVTDVNSFVLVDEKVVHRGRQLQFTWSRISVR